MASKSGICARCKKLKGLTTHHRIPRCKGGDNSHGNLLRVCRPCHDILDHEAGVRPKRGDDKPAKMNPNRCKCGNSLKKARVFGTQCLKCYYKAEGEKLNQQRSQAQVAWFEKEGLKNA